MNEKSAIWPLKPHTKAKHDLLQRYLGGWFPVLSRFHGRIIFLDGFAGPGVYSHGEPGSPTIALKTLLDHQHAPYMRDKEFVFIFNERDPERFESLTEQVEALRGDEARWPDHVKVNLSNVNFVEMAEDILASLGERDRKLAPTFAFLDPFGYSDVPLDVIRRLLSFDHCELFIYFDYNSVSRFATAGVVDPKFEALFGTDEFKQAPPSGSPNRKAFLHDLYQRQLSQVCGFPYVQSFEMVNGQNRTGNYLFFCTRNLKGLEIMKEAMWKIAPGGDFKFSDLLAGQSVLFEDEVDTRPLQVALLARFSGQTVSIEDVENYALIHTPFAKSHVKTRTLAPMQREGLISSPYQRKRNTYPAGTLINFP